MKLTLLIYCYIFHVICKCTCMESYSSSTDYQFSTNSTTNQNYILENNSNDDNNTYSNSSSDEIDNTIRARSKSDNKWNNKHNINAEIQEKQMYDNSCTTLSQSTQENTEDSQLDADNQQLYTQRITQWFGQECASIMNQYRDLVAKVGKKELTIYDVPFTIYNKEVDHESNNSSIAKILYNDEESDIRITSQSTTLPQIIKCALSLDGKNILAQSIGRMHIPINPNTQTTIFTAKNNVSSFLHEPIVFEINTIYGMPHPNKGYIIVFQEDSNYRLIKTLQILKFNYEPNKDKLYSIEQRPIRSPDEIFTNLTLRYEDNDIRALHTLQHMLTVKNCRLELFDKSKHRYCIMRNDNDSIIDGWAVQVYLGNIKGIGVAGVIAIRYNPDITSNQMQELAASDEHTKYNIEKGTVKYTNKRNFAYVPAIVYPSPLPRIVGEMYHSVKPYCDCHNIDSSFSVAVNCAVASVFDATYISNLKFNPDGDSGTCDVYGNIFINTLLPKPISDQQPIELKANNCSANYTVHTLFADNTYNFNALPE